MPNTNPLVRAKPFIDAIDARGGPLALVPPPGRGESWVRHLYERGRQQGYMSLWVADELCVKVLGTLPHLLYGPDWFEADYDIPADAEPFAPGRQSVTLTDDDRQAIGRLFAEGVGQADIARRFGVGKSHVSKVVCRLRESGLLPAPAGV